MELANGCICCTVADDFIPTIEALMALEPRPDHILIETSGLALPKPLLKAFDWPDIRSKITVDGVIALADAEAVAAGRFASDVSAVDKQREADDSIDHETPLSEVFGDQISCADIVLLTKPDLAGPEGVAKAKDIVLNAAPRPLPVVEVAEGQVDPRVILGLEAAAEDDMDGRPSDHDDHHHVQDGDGHHHHHHHDDHHHDNFESIVVDIPELADPADLVTAIETLANENNILRVKGYAAVAGKPMRLLVQAVGARVRHQFDRPWAASEDRQGRLVVIAEHDDIKRDVIEAALGAAKADA
jgi:cobalamin biosynthesis protein CobW